MTLLPSIEGTSVSLDERYLSRSKRSNRAACEPRRVDGAVGFTLIELMIVVAIIAILAAIAVPSYGRYVVKTHRVAAQACLSEYANYMERYYTTNLSYAKDAAGTDNALPALDCASPQRTGTNYRYELPKASLTASAFSVTATPINAQETRDSRCGTLSLNQTGLRGPTTAGCW